MSPLLFVGTFFAAPLLLALMILREAPLAIALFPAVTLFISFAAMLHAKWDLIKTRQFDRIPETPQPKTTGLLLARNTLVLGLLLFIIVYIRYSL